MRLEAQTGPGPRLLPGPLPFAPVAEKARPFLEVTLQGGQQGLPGARHGARGWSCPKAARIWPGHRQVHCRLTHASRSEYNEVAEHGMYTATPLYR